MVSPTCIQNICEMKHVINNEEFNQPILHPYNVLNVCAHIIDRGYIQLYTSSSMVMGRRTSNLIHVIAY